MDVLTEIKQESAVIACEKWRRRRPSIKFPLEAEAETRLYQVFASCSSTREVFHKCIIESTLKSGGTVLIFDCDHSVKFGQLLTNFSCERLNGAVDFFGIYDYSTYCSLWEQITKILFERPNVSTIIFSGISNPYFYHQKRRRDKQMITMANFAAMQIEKIKKSLQPYKVTIFIMNAQETEDDWSPNFNGKIKFVKTPSHIACQLQNSPNEPVIEINCLF